MKNKFLLIILSSFLLASCGEDFLELSPSESISETEAVNTEAKLNAVLIGAYDELQASYYMPHVIMLSDVKGEDVFVKSSGNYGRHVQEYQYKELTTNGRVEDVWEQAYEITNNVNRLLEAIPNVEMDADAKLQLEAEAKALRGHTLLNLVQFFAKPYSIDKTSLGVPVITKPVLVSDVPASRATVEAVYTQIISDLTFAAEKLVASSKERITTSATKGLLARAYLNMEDWTNASKWSKAAYKDYALMSAEALLGGFQDRSNSEWMWAIKSVADDNTGYLHVASFYGENGYSSLRLDVDFRTKFGADDARLGQISEGLSSGGHKSLKFEHVGGWVMDQVLMRASEMYLIEAEAEAELGNNLAAQTALFAIQSRADATAIISTNTGSELVDEILLERRKELWGEGFRMFDLNRRGSKLTRTSSSHWAKLDLPIDDTKRIWPIPQNEIDANSNMKQNPGYNN